MGVGRDRLTPEGQRFYRELEELKKLEVRVGFQHGKATEEGGVDVCDVAAFNELGTSRSPSRPFIRMSVDDNEGKINNFLKGQMRDFTHGKPAEQVLKEIGIFQKDLMQEKIESGDFAPNAESTIAKKGSSKPLIDSGNMRQAVDYEIKTKGSD